MKIIAWRPPYLTIRERATFRVSTVSTIPEQASQKPQQVNFISLVKNNNLMHAFILDFAGTVMQTNIGNIFPEQGKKNDYTSDFNLVDFRKPHHE